MALVTVLTIVMAIAKKLGWVSAPKMSKNAKILGDGLYGMVPEPQCGAP